MPTFLAEILTQMRNIWAQLNGAQRVTTGAVVAGTLVLMASLVYFATRPDFVAFGNDLIGEDRQGVIAALEEKGIDYRIENGLIRVNGSQKSDAEKALDAKGLRSSEGGDDDTGSFTHDRERRKWALQIKKVRRVEAQLRKMKGVRSALVNLYDPSGPNLLTAREARRASVMVDLVRPSSFTSVGNAVRSIVASSLGIAEDDVHVTDSNSQTLGGAGGAQSSGFSPLLALQSQTSNELTMRARQLLEHVWPGKTHVVVSALYDNKVVESQRKIISPDKVVLGETSYKTKDSTGAAARGDPNGVGSTNDTSAAQVPVKDSSVTQTDKRYQPVIGEESTRVLAPDLKRLSISLSIDESLSGMKNEIETQVKNSVGWIEARDSNVTAMVVKFEEFENLPEASGTIAMVKEWAPLGGQILSVLLVILFLRGLLKRNKTTFSAEAAASRVASEPAKEEDPTLQTVRLRKEIEKAVAEDSASVSRLLESWLANKETA